MEFSAKSERKSETNAAVHFASEGKYIGATFTST
jgi:hypothetical protein